MNSKEFSKGRAGRFSLLSSPLANIVLAILPATRCFLLKRTLLNALGFEIGAGSRLAGGSKFYGRGALIIGQNCWIGHRCAFYLTPSAPVTIHENCDIAPQVTIHTGSHHLGPASRRAGVGYSRSIEIGKGSWIGTNATLLAGAHVGESTIVAAGAVVIGRRYAPNTLLCGVPAVEKSRFQA